MRNTLIAVLTLSFLPVSSIAQPVVAQDAAPAAPALTAARGKMLLSTDGARLATVYRVSGEGAQIILDGRMVTVPGGTLTLTGGKLTTSLTKSQVVALP